MPKPRNALFPLILVLLVLLLVLGVVLSANGGRNLTALLKAVDLPLPQFLAFVPPSPAPAAPDVVPAAAALWPWLKGVSHHAAPPTSMSTPDAMCRSLTSDGQEAPSFVKSGADGWECTMLFATSKDPASSSLFLQVRGGEDGQFTMVRVKFNLTDGRLTEDLARHSISFLHAAMTLPASERLDETLVEKLAIQADFYFVAGYHALTFRREVDDPDRYNLIGFNRKVIGMDRVTAWPKDADVEEAATARAPKGPRLSLQSVGSP